VNRRRPSTGIESAGFGWLQNAWLRLHARLKILTGG
jgi:hypothetical protein